MKAKKISFLVLTLVAAITFFSFAFSKNIALAEKVNDTHSLAKSMVLIEANTGRVLYGKNYSEKRAMASTTKIITALTVLNNCDNIHKEIKIHDNAVGISGTSIYLKKGESLSIEELLYGLMLPSGNDAATALAYHIGGDIPTFCKMMEQTALSCGAENSSFANPHGLDEDGHYTTALDLAKITAKALENETFCKIVTTKSTRIKGSTEGTYRYLKNKNKLLNTLNGCIGVKTGYTDDAGRCLVSACERNGFRTICVVLNCGPMFEESADLFERAYQEYSYVELLPEYKIIRRLQVENGKTNNVKVYTKKSFKYPLTLDEAKRVEFRYNLPNSLKAPIKQDECVGNLEIYLDNHLLFFEKIYTIDNIQKIGVWSNIQDIISNW